MSGACDRWLAACEGARPVLGAGAVAAAGEWGGDRSYGTQRWLNRMYATWQHAVIGSCLHVKVPDLSLGRELLQLLESMAEGRCYDAWSWLGGTYDSAHATCQEDLTGG